MSDQIESETDEDAASEYSLPALPSLRVYPNKIGGISIQSFDDTQENFIVMSRDRVDWMIETLTALRAEL